MLFFPAVHNNGGQTMPFCQTEETYRKLIIRIYSDTPPLNGHASMAYIFGQTPENEDVALQAAAKLYHEGVTPRIAFDNLPPNPETYSGPEAWRDHLQSLGVNPEHTLLIELASELPPSTDAEAWGLVRYIRRAYWDSLIIIATQIHQLRAFITTVSYLVKERMPYLRVYNSLPSAKSWMEEVRHSATMPRASRFEQLDGEFAKIERYYGKGDLLPGETVLNYLDKRDVALTDEEVERNGKPTSRLIFGMAWNELALRGLATSQNYHYAYYPDGDLIYCRNI